MRMNTLVVLKRRSAEQEEERVIEIKQKKFNYKFYENNDKW